MRTYGAPRLFTSAGRSFFAPNTALSVNIANHCDPHNSPFSISNMYHFRDDIFLSCALGVALPNHASPILPTLTWARDGKTSFYGGRRAQMIGMCWIWILIPIHIVRMGFMTHSAQMGDG